MSQKIFISALLLLIASSVSGQRIVVDSTSSNKYIIKKEPSIDTPVENSEEVSFSDRAVSIGMGILNRLKARFNLEEAAESIKDKKNQYLGKRDEEVKDPDN